MEHSASIIVNEEQQRIVKPMEIPFAETESPYDPEFVAKILRGDEDIKAGRVSKIKVEDLWK